MKSIEQWIDIFEKDGVPLSELLVRVRNEAVEAAARESDTADALSGHADVAFYVRQLKEPG